MQFHFHQHKQIFFSSRMADIHIKQHSVIRVKNSRSFNQLQISNYSPSHKVWMLIWTPGEASDQQPNKLSQEVLTSDKNEIASVILTKMSTSRLPCERAVQDRSCVEFRQPGGHEEPYPELSRHSA